MLNRDVWSSLQVSRVLVGLLVAACAMTGPIVVGSDETIERRRGARIAANGIYRDPVRSSHGHFVKASGLRWISLLLLVPIPWAARTWAVPVLTAVAPSTRDDAERGRRHQTSTLDQWAVSALRKFMLAYSGRVRRGLVVPNRVRLRVADDAWAEVIAGAGVIEEPFVLGPPVQESEILRGVRRPLTSGPRPGAARASALEQVEAAAHRALELARQ